MASEDSKYWSDLYIPILTSLIKSTGSYSPAEEAAQLRVVSDHVIPNLGPRPSVAYTMSYMTQTGSPLQPSINFSGGKQKVRYCWELLGPNGGSDSDPFCVGATREILASFASAFGYSTQWSDVLQSAFALTPEEVKVAQRELPKWLAEMTGGPAPPIKRFPFVFVAFDMEGTKTAVKIYFNPTAKQLATGTPATENTFKVLRTLSPALNPATLDDIQTFLAERPDRCPVELVAIDCPEESRLSDARVKLYVPAWNNSFNTVREFVTLGGRVEDPTVLKGLAVLKGIWHLLLQEPEGVADDYDKPLNDASFPGHKLYVSYEIKPGAKFPEAKIYLPTWNYVRTDAETVDNLEQMFRMCGHAWGEKGKYKEVFESAFGPVAHQNPKPIHSDTAFLYSEKKGLYQTLYFSPSLAPEKQG